MRTHALAVLAALLGCAIVVGVISTSSTPRTAYAQGGSCPGSWQSTNCVTMPPPLNDSIASSVRPDGIWSDHFNSGSGDCVSLYNHFQSAYSSGRVVVADMPLNQWGAYYGSGDQQGEIGIANASFNVGNNDFVASIAIHESAHDFGCDDTSPGQTAQAWADYCVPPDPQVPPPPPLPCSGM